MRSQFRREILRALIARKTRKTGKARIIFRQGLRLLIKAHLQAVLHAPQIIVRGRQFFCCRRIYPLFLRQHMQHFNSAVTT